MTNEPNPANEPENNSGNPPPTPPRPRRRRLRRVGILLSLSLLIGVGGGLVYAWYFIQRQLAPLVQKNLTETLNRPIQLGKVEGFSLGGVRFGESQIPATATDPDRGTVKSIDANFNLVQLLLTRQLDLEINLRGLNAYIEQDKQGRWISTTLKTQENKGPIKTELKAVRLRDAAVVLVARAKTGKLKPPVVLTLNTGQGNRFLTPNERFNFDLAGKFQTGGDFTVKGEYRPKGNTQADLELSGQKVNALNISQLLELPLILQGGRVSTNSLKVFLRENQPTTFQGTATLDNVTARVPKLPQPFTQAKGQVRFQGSKIQLEKVTAVFGQIPALAEGSLDTQKGFNLTAKTNPITISQVLRTFKLPNAPVALAGVVQANLSVTGSLSKPIVSGRAIATKLLTVDRVTFNSFSTNFGVVNSTLAVNNLRATPTVGGLVQGQGIVRLTKNGSLLFNAIAADIPADALARNYGRALPVRLGLVSGTAQISGFIGNLKNLQIRSTGTLNIGGGTVTASNIQLRNNSFTAQLQANNVRLAQLTSVPAQLSSPISGNIALSGNLANPQISSLRVTGTGRLNVGSGTVTASNIQLLNNRFTAQIIANRVNIGNLAPVPPQFRVPVSGVFNVAGNLNNLSPSTLAATGSGRLNIGGGSVIANNIRLANGRFTALVQASGVQVGSLAAQVPPQLRRERLFGTFNVAGNLNNISPTTLTANGSGRLNIGSGTVTASNVRVANGQFATQLRVVGVNVGSLATVPPQFRGPLSGLFNVSGSLTNPQLTAIRANGTGRLNVAGGTVNASNIQLVGGRFTALVQPNNVQLAQINPQLQGLLAGNLNVSGSVTALSPSAIRASGQVNFSRGLAAIDRPLTASIAWNGQRLQINSATAQGLAANGYVDVNLANRGTDIIRAFNLNVAANDLNLQELPVKLPNGVNVAGRADFDGKIAGNIANPNVSGDLRLRNFIAGGLAFEPLLTGNVRSTGQGINLQLNGTQDRIAVALGTDYKPNSFDIQRGEAIATGRRQGNQLLVAVSDFPITTLKSVVPLPNEIATQPLSGQIFGNLAVNLNNYGITGDIRVNNPIFATLRGNQFTGSFQYANGVIALNNGRFTQNESEYLLSANLTQSPTGPKFNANVQVARGELQDVLTAAAFFNLSDLTRGFNLPTYGRATDVQAIAVGLPGSTLEAQLRRLSEIEALLAQQQAARRGSSPLPELSEAKGKFTGTVTVAGSLREGINANFNIEGENWQWGNLSAQDAIVRGSFQDGILTLLPLRLQTEDRLLTFSGNLGGETQSGQLRVRNVPIAEIQQFVNLPPTIGVTGNLNATASLSGSLKNPQAIGELSVADGTLNQTPIQSAQGSFSYNNARLEFSSDVLLAKTATDGTSTAVADPLSLRGSIPYKLPFASVSPNNNQLTLNIDVKNEGLALLNLLTNNQVAWVDGTGTVKLDVTGQIDPETRQPRQILAEGVATVSNATVRSQALQDPLTNVNGRILFNLDRVDVENVRGEFSGGQVVASGTIPINQPTPQENPLTLNLEKLAINLKGLYNGGVRGNVAITGTALEPDLGGQVELFDGQVQLAEASTSGIAGTGEANGIRNRAEFKNLQLTLDRNVQVVREPLLSFLAAGSLQIDGTLDNPRPQGTIELKRGQVNLFTTQFRLAKGYTNVAQFLPNRGLDPELDVRLTAVVAETTQRRIPIDPSVPEIADPIVTSLGSVQSVRVQARVQGPASQLNQRLELTSSPSRSEAEIVALIGGGFIDNLGRGDSTLGLVNLAGSAFLGNVQNVIGDALGLSEFRIFPTYITTNDNNRSSTLGLGAEAGVDITNSFSVSALKILTTDDPFQFSLRYRLNDNTLVRASTNLAGDNGLAVEYELRF